MLAEMTSPLFSEWVAFLDLYHEESTRAGAMVSAAVYNAMGDGKRTWVPRDFLPGRVPPSDEDQDPEEMRAALMGCGPNEEV